MARYESNIRLWTIIAIATFFGIGYYWNLSGGRSQKGGEPILTLFINTLHFDLAQALTGFFLLVIPLAAFSVVIGWIVQGFLVVGYRRIRAANKRDAANKDVQRT